MAAEQPQPRPKRRTTANLSPLSNFIEKRMFSFWSPNRTETEEQGQREKALKEWNDGVWQRRREEKEQRRAAQRAAAKERKLKERREAAAKRAAELSAIGLVDPHQRLQPHSSDELADVLEIDREEEEKKAREEIAQKLEAGEITQIEADAAIAAFDEAGPETFIWSKATLAQLRKYNRKPVQRDPNKPRTPPGQVTHSRTACSSPAGSA
jgi:hypothetical protein